MKSVRYVENVDAVDGVRRAEGATCAWRLHK